VPEDVASFLAQCDDNTMCVPDDFIETAGNFIAKSCESVLGAEGRCMSTCLPLVAEQADQLPKAGCPTNQRCVPCFDPFDGADTGACALSCDPGPSEPPIEFPRCCGDIGSCLPKDLVPADQVDNFDGYDCPQGNGDMICVPTPYLYPPYEPPACETGWTSGIFGDKYKPGACVPECLPAVQGIFNSLVLGQDGCPGGHVCAPCLVPTSGDPSGACTVIGGSCEGACGGESADGCWCDAECSQYGDCCMDVCDACGECG